MEDHDPIVVSSFEPGDRAGLLDMILTIQRGEFGRFDPEEERADLIDIASTYQQGAGGFWVAKSDGVVIGCVALKDMGGRRVTLKRMYVARDWRGRPGTAVRLLEEALRHARAAGALDVYLGTIDILASARRFYPRQGFAPIDRRDLPADVALSSDDTHFFHRRLTA